MTFWGVPGDPRHNSSRGWECVAGGVFANQVGKALPARQPTSAKQPFLTLPTSCTGESGGEP